MVVALFVATAVAMTDPPAFVLADSAVTKVVVTPKGGTVALVYRDGTPAGHVDHPFLVDLRNLRFAETSTAWPGLVRFDCREGFLNGWEAEEWVKHGYVRRADLVVAPGPLPPAALDRYDTACNLFVRTKSVQGGIWLSVATEDYRIFQLYEVDGDRITPRGRRLLHPLTIVFFVWPPAFGLAYLLAKLLGSMLYRRLTSSSSSS